MPIVVVVCPLARLAILSFFFVDFLLSRAVQYLSAMLEEEEEEEETEE